MNKKALFCIRVRDSDPLGTRLAERGLVARAARACRRCARVALQYSPTHTIVWGTPIRPTYEVADFCALVKESEQAECRDKMLAFWHDRGAAVDAKGVKSTTTSVSTISW